MRPARAFALLCLAAAVAAPAAAWQNVEECLTPPFQDLGSDSMVCMVTQYKISLGCGGGTYCPEEPMSRAALAMMLERAMRGTATWAPWRGWSSGGASPGRMPITIVVNPVPGDPTASGEALRNVFLGILDNSADQPYLVKVEPGVFDLGNTPLNVKPYVDLEGSGESMTRIIGQPVNVSDSVLILAAHCEIRNLTVAATNGAGFSVLAFNNGGLGGPRRLLHTTLEHAVKALVCQNVELSLSHTRVLVSNPSPGSTTALYANGCLLDIEDSTVEATGSAEIMAVYVHGSATVKRSTLRATGGSSNNALVVDQGSVLLEDDVLHASGQDAEALALWSSHATLRRTAVEASGPSSAVVNASSNAGARRLTATGSRFVGGELLGDENYDIVIAESLLDGVNVSVSNGGSVTCFKTFDGDFTNPNGLTACP